MKRGLGLFMLVLVAGCGGAGDTPGTGGGDMGPGGAGGGKRVFVTSGKFLGTAVGGICQTVADSVSLGGSWIEWLSYGAKSPPRSAIDVIQGAGPWKLLDGTVAFSNHAQLATSPSVALSLSERGAVVGELDDDVWTGTLTGGAHSGSDCQDWSMSGSAGTMGRASVASEWTAYGANANCTNNAHVYCFEQ